MRRNTLQLMAFTSAVALGFAATKTVVAQDTVTTTIILSSAIATTDVSDMDFGTWLIQLDAPGFADVADITLTDTGPISTTASGTATTSGNSQVVQITAGATRGVVNVQTPAPAVLNMTRSNEVAFAPATAFITLNAATYVTATENGAIAPAGTVPVTVTAGATDEAVNFGGVVRVAGGQPADNTYVSSFDVSFAY